MTTTEHKNDKILKLLHTAKQNNSKQLYADSATDYSEALELMTKVPDTSPRKCEIFLEYAESLVKNFCLESAMRYEKLMTKSITGGNNSSSNTSTNLNTNSIVPGDEDDTDLEIAWNVLQISLNVYKKLKDREKLFKCYLLISEIHMLNNCFEDAINEYSKALLITNISNSSSNNNSNIVINNQKNEKILVLKNMATCYEYVDDAKCREYYQMVIDLSDTKEEKKEVEDLLEYYNARKEVREQLDAQRNKSRGNVNNNISNNSNSSNNTNIVNNNEEEEEFVDISEKLKKN